MKTTTQEVTVPSKSYAAPLNDSLVRDIVWNASHNPSSLRFKFYAREMEHVMETQPLSTQARLNLAAAIRDEKAKGHR